MGVYTYYLLAPSRMVEVQIGKKVFPAAAYTFLEKVSMWREKRASNMINARVAKSELAWSKYHMQDWPMFAVHVDSRDGYKPVKGSSVRRWFNRLISVEDTDFGGNLSIGDIRVEKVGRKNRYVVDTGEQMMIYGMQAANLMDYPDAAFRAARQKDLDRYLNILSFIQDANS